MAPIPCECGFWDRDRPHSKIGGGCCAHFYERRAAQEAPKKLHIDEEIDMEDAEHSVQADYLAAIDAAKQEIEHLRAENDALREDAERYRKIRPYLGLRQCEGVWWLGDSDFIGYGKFSSIDTAIDAMRGEEE